MSEQYEEHEIEGDWKQLVVDLFTSLIDSQTKVLIVRGQYTPTVKRKFSFDRLMNIFYIRTADGSFPIDYLFSIKDNTKILDMILGELKFQEHFPLCGLLIAPEQHTLSDRDNQEVRMSFPEIPLIYDIIGRNMGFKPTINNFIQFDPTEHVFVVVYKKSQFPHKLIKLFKSTGNMRPLRIKLVKQIGLSADFNTLPLHVTSTQNGITVASSEGLLENLVVGSNAPTLNYELTSLRPLKEIEANLFYKTLHLPLYIPCSLVRMDVHSVSPTERAECVFWSKEEGGQILVARNEKGKFPLSYFLQLQDNTHQKVQLHKRLKQSMGAMVFRRAMGNTFSKLSEGSFLVLHIKDEVPIKTSFLLDQCYASLYHIVYTALPGLSSTENNHEVSQKEYKLPSGGIFATETSLTSRSGRENAVQLLRHIFDHTLMSHIRHALRELSPAYQFRTENAHTSRTGFSKSIEVPLRSEESFFLETLDYQSVYLYFLARVARFATGKKLRTSQWTAENESKILFFVLLHLSSLFGDLDSRYAEVAMSSPKTSQNSLWLNVTVDKFTIIHS